MRPEPQLLRAGQTLKLSCKVQGTPLISIMWLKNGSEVTPDQRHILSFDGSIASLELEACCVEDGGEYVCVASSQAGQDQCSTMVTIKGWFSASSSSSSSS